MREDASNESAEERIARLLREYAPDPVAPGPIPRALTLRGDLGLESLTLVSVALRLGEELGVDMVEAGVDLSGIETVGDLVALGQKLVAPASRADLTPPPPLSLAPLPRASGEELQARGEAEHLNPGPPRLSEEGPRNEGPPTEGEGGWGVRSEKNRHGGPRCPDKTTEIRRDGAGAGTCARSPEGALMARSTQGGPRRPQKVGGAGGSGAGGGGPGDLAGRVSVRLAPEELARIDALAGLLAGKGPPGTRAEMLRQLVRRGLELLEEQPEKARALLAGVPPPDPPDAGASPRKKGRGKVTAG